MCHVVPARAFLRHATPLSRFPASKALILRLLLYPLSSSCFLRGLLTISHAGDLVGFVGIAEQGLSLGIRSASHEIRL